MEAAMVDPSRGRVFMYRKICMVAAVVFLLTSPAVRASPLSTAAPKSESGLIGTVREWVGSLIPALGRAGHELSALWQNEGIQIDPDGGGHR